MSTEKRNLVLIVVAVIVVALGGFYWFNASSVQSKSATGAIGAVQKLHEPQIAAKDVVLGDEKTKKSANVRYAGFLADADRLQKASAKLGVAVLNQKGAEAGSAIQAELASHSAEVMNRYYGAMDEALASITQVMSREQLEAKQLASINADVAQLQAFARNRAAVESATMEQYNARLGSVIEQLQAHMASRGLKQMESALASAIAPLQGKGKLQSSDMLRATSQLESSGKELSSFSGSDAQLGSYVHYLGEMAAESKILANAKAELASKSELNSKLMNVSVELANEAAALESRALANMEASLASRIEVASALRNMEGMLNNAAQLGKGAQVESRTLESFNAQLSSFQRELSNKNAEFANRAAADMQAELASVSGVLANHEQLANQLASQSNLANRGEMANKGELANKGALANQNQLAQFSQALASKSVLANYQTHLANVSRNLESKTMFASHLANQEKLASQAHELQNRASMLGSAAKY